MHGGEAGGDKADRRLCDQPERRRVGHARCEFREIPAHKRGLPEAVGKQSDKSRQEKCRQSNLSILATTQPPDLRERKHDDGQVDKHFRALKGAVELVEVYTFAWPLIGRIVGALPIPVAREALNGGGDVKGDGLKGDEDDEEDGGEPDIGTFKEAQEEGENGETGESKCLTGDLGDGEVGL